jgi:hypothetical protein
MTLALEHLADSISDGGFVCEICAQPEGFVREFCRVVAERLATFATAFRQSFLGFVGTLFARLRTHDIANLASSRTRVQSQYASRACRKHWPTRATKCPVVKRCFAISIAVVCSGPEATVCRPLLRSEIPPGSGHIASLCR